MTKCIHPSCQREASKTLQSGAKHGRVLLRYRGMCITCWRDESVRALYPSLSKYSFSKIGYRDFMGTAPLPEPTDALPGTEDKIRVLYERAKRGQRLFHPRDGAAGWLS